VEIIIMKILCSHSSLEFTTEHFPGTFYSKEICHPIFYLPQKKLLSYTSKWAAGELTPTDSYLLFLALLKSSDRVEFRVPVFKTPFTDSIVAQNMEFLVRTVIKLNTVVNPSVVFPSFAITPETKFLSNVKYWIESWHSSYEEFRSGKFKEYDNRALAHRESALQRMIKNPHKPISSYATQIADWANLAGSFPSFIVSSPFTRNTQITCDVYWKQIIVKCARDESIFSIPRNDLTELIEHCETNIPVGSGIYSHALFKVLRSGLEKQKNFLGLGDFDIGETTYQFLESSDSTESANIKAMIDSAPTEIPRPDQYPNKIAYFRAKNRWDMAQKFAKETGTSTGETE
jgi:hypothetical protein